MPLPQWTTPNNYNLGTFQERQAVVIDLPVLKTFDLTTQIISGRLPSGLRLENNRIVGTINNVSKTTETTFVIRGTTQSGITDRTFSLTVDGSDVPEWVTGEGLLPVGPNQVLFILDNSLIEYQLKASDEDLSAGDELNYFIADGDGSLPPGVQLTEDGRLVGFVEKLPTLEFTDADGSFDTTGYDNAYFDFAYEDSTQIKTPRKINRNFEFIATVTDNVSFAKRRFIIYVVSPDFVRADNVLMTAGTNVFTADTTYLRKPLWVTPANLGVKRANNYITIILDVIEASLYNGEVRYFLEPLNIDGTPSRLPNNVILDEDTGEIAGIVPYQPAITETYNFTVNATRSEKDSSIAVVFFTVLDDIYTGSQVINVAKLKENEAELLAGKDVVIENAYYTIDNITQFDTYSAVNLRQPLVATSKHSPIVVAKDAVANNTHFFVNNLTQVDREFYKGRTAEFGTEQYQINELYPYVEFVVSSSNNLGLVDSTNNIVGSLISELSYNGRTAYVTQTSSRELVMTLPATADNRNINLLKNLFTGTVKIKEVGQWDRLLLSSGVTTRDLEVGDTASYGIVSGDVFRKNLIVSTENVAENKKQFKINIVGEVEDTIEWTTESNLGSIKANRISNLYVNAKVLTGNSVIKYFLTSGNLPTGLSLSANGEIVGKIPVFATDTQKGLTFFDKGKTTFDGGTTTFDRGYEFNIQAKDRYGYTEINRTFSLKIDDDDRLNYSNLYAQPFLKTEQKNEFLRLMGNSSIISPELLYRPFDESFGVQKKLRVLIFGGIETRSLADFVKTTAKNHKKKRFYTGSLDYAVAKIEGTDEVVYEVVYLNLIDPANATNGKASKYVKTPNLKRITVDSGRYGQDNIKHPYHFKPNNSLITVDNDGPFASNKRLRLSNIDNMKDQIKVLGSESKDFIPLWMRTAQQNSLSELGYILAVPLVYTVPGGGKTILDHMVNNNYDFSFIDYEVDRYIVDSTTGSSQEQYVVFADYIYNI